MSDFSNSLLRAAKDLDVPAAGAKARASAQLGTALTAGAGSVATTTVVAATASSLKVAVLAAAAVVLLIGGTAAVVSLRDPREHARPEAIAPLPVPAERTASASAALPSAKPRTTPATESPTAAEANACTAHALADGPPKTCSTKNGKVAPIALVSRCGEDVDVFWVDFKCEEVFYSRLGAGQTFRHTASTGDVWRIRDHGTHQLLKELQPVRLPGAPEWSGPDTVRALPDVVITTATNLEETKPPFCSGVGRRTNFLIKNEREDQLVVFWVGLECEEKFWRRVGPKESLPIEGRDGDAWRVRTAKGGELVLDIAPEIADFRETITVP